MNMGIQRTKEKILHSNNFFYTLVRSTMSAQFCGWIDTILSFCLFAFCGLTAWLSTAIAAFIGGILNCLINYRFTFQTKGVALKVAITKFGFAWIGSLLLNSFGTQEAYYLFKDWHWLSHTLGMSQDTIFLASRLFVALVVSIFWNFLLQKYVVFRPTPIDKYIQAIYDLFSPHRLKTGKKD